MQGKVASAVFVFNEKAWKERPPQEPISCRNAELRSGAFSFQRMRFHAFASLGSE
jgi:hypothetical protein